MGKKRRNALRVFRNVANLIWAERHCHLNLKEFQSLLELKSTSTTYFDIYSPSGIEVVTFEQRKIFLMNSFSFLAWCESYYMIMRKCYRHFESWRRRRDKKRSALFRALNKFTSDEMLQLAFTWTLSKNQKFLLLSVNFTFGSNTVRMLIQSTANYL